MFKQIFVLVAAFGMTGCAALEKSNMRDTQYAAFAASSKIPGAEASDELRATALIDREEKTIRVLNPTDRSIRNAKVWINRNFVTPVDNIPSHGSVTLRRDEFYNSSGLPLTKSDTTASVVQLEEGGKLYNLLGPVFD
jgi:hypothetical protein